MQKKQVQGLKHQVEQLAQFLIRLSKHYEGVAPELDKELQTLRSHLGGMSNFALAEVSISKLTGLLLKNQDSIRKQNTKASTLLEKAIKQLQSKEHLPKTIQSEATDFLVKLQSQHTSAFNTLPQFERAIGIYNLALDNVELHRANTSVEDTNTLVEAVNVKLHEEISHELRELVGQLSLNNRGDKQLSEVKNMLIRGLSHEELLECCLIIIKAIVKDVIKERAHAEKFVTGLHNSLHKVNNAVGQSIEDAQSKFEEKASTSEALREHLEGIGQAVKTHDDIKQLKAQATEYLEKMNSTLESREQADKDEQIMLMNLLNEMKTQLSSLEQETAEYKHRLIEQKLQSHHDALTQIPNRTAYNERVTLEYRRWKRHQNNLSMALVDVDLFKNINDSYGHSAGDKTLQVIAQNISRCLRSTDFLARWGGEEFVVLFPQTSAADLHKPLEAIRKQIQRIPFKFKQEKVTITVSIGATEFTTEDSVESAFERADAGLYEAKNSGRNCCIIK